MTDDRRTPAQIESDIDAERARLSQNLSVLQDRLTVDGIMGEVRTQVRHQVDDVSVQVRRHLETAADDIGHQLRGQVGTISRTLGQAAKRNPLPMALIGIGIGWLALRSMGSDDNTVVQARPAYAPIKRTATPAHYDMSPADMAAKELEDEADSWVDGNTRQAAKPISPYDADPSWARDDTVRTPDRRS